MYQCKNTMRTTLDIPKKLIDEAMEVIGAKTKRKHLIMLKGTIDLDIDLDKLRDRN